VSKNLLPFFHATRARGVNGSIWVGGWGGVFILCCGGTMELEEQGLNPRDIVKHVVRTAIAATRERNISIQAIVADDVPTLVVS